MGPIPITLVIVAGFAGFCWLAWRKLAIVRALQPEPRRDHVRARLVNVLTLGLLQTRMIGGEPRPGIMHAVIFVGFMTLLVRKVQLLIIGYDPLFVYPGVAGGLYAAFKDFIELAVTAAVLYGFWRRFVARPRRREPNREAILVLSLILAIMVTDFLYDGYESQGNPWGLPADTRGDWAKGLGVPVLDSPQQAAGLEYLFYVGSAQSFDARGQKVARAFVKILRAANVKFAILGAAEGSTGECVRRTGNEMLFQDLARKLAGTLNELRVTRIVTCDPHAFNSLRNEYPEFGGRYRVVHHTQLLSELLDEGRISVRAAFERVLYHDPCYLGRHNGVYDAPRRVVRRLCRGEPPEFDRKREKSLCCGAGGDRMWMEERIGGRINVLRAEQALARSPAVIATACPYCALMLSDGVAQIGGQDSVPVRDVAELVAESLNG